MKTIMITFPHNSSFNGSGAGVRGALCVHTSPHPILFPMLCGLRFDLAWGEGDSAASRVVVAVSAGHLRASFYAKCRKGARGWVLELSVRRWNPKQLSTEEDKL
jgi:hypothetical protein